MIRVISARDIAEKKGRLVKNRTIKVPKFKSEDQEREFWAKNDVTDYFDVKIGKKMNFSNLKPSTQTISIRLLVTTISSVLF